MARRITARTETAKTDISAVTHRASTEEVAAQLIYLSDMIGREASAILSTGRWDPMVLLEISGRVDELLRAYVCKGK